MTDEALVESLRQSTLKEIANRLETPGRLTARDLKEFTMAFNCVPQRPVKIMSDHIMVAVGAVLGEEGFDEKQLIDVGKRIIDKAKTLAAGSQSTGQKDA